MLHCIQDSKAEVNRDQHPGFLRFAYRGLRNGWHRQPANEFRGPPLSTNTANTGD